MYNNPFLNMGQPLKTPQQYQQELNQQMQQYNQMYNQTQQNNINVNANNLNGYDGYIKYVNNYNDVENAQVPMNGTPVLFINGDGSLAWCKKFVNGQNYCDVYNLSKSQNNAFLKQDNINTQENEKNDFNAILVRLEAIERRLSNEQSTTNDTKPIKKA